MKLLALLGLMFHREPVTTRIDYFDERSNWLGVIEWNTAKRTWEAYRYAGHTPWHVGHARTKRGARALLVRSLGPVRATHRRTLTPL